MKDIAADASQKAADQVRPSEDQLAQIDQPAEENTWHEKPNLSKDDLKSKLKKSDKSTADTPAIPETTPAYPQTQNTAVYPQTTTGYPQTTETADNESVTPSEMSRRKKYANQTKEYLQDKIPKERREQTIWRLKKMIIEVQGHADYQQAIETILDLAEKYAGHTKGAAAQSGSAAKDVRSNDNVKAVEKDLRTLIERFANNTSLADFFESLNNIYRDADNDPELRGWFSDIDTFIRKALREQGFIMEDECTRQWNVLYDKGRYLARERYRNHTDKIVDQIKFLADQFEQDPQNKALADSVQKLFLDLGRDSDGKVVFKKHLLSDVRDIILPGLFENVRYVPIPRIEVSDPMIDVVIENLTIESDNLMPNVVEFGSDNYFRWGRKKISNKRDNKIMIAASGIQADLRDVSYYIKKKQGFPSITDTGIMDIFLGGEGFSFKIAASTADKSDKQHFVKLDKVSVNIKNMDIKLRKSKHKALFATFKPMLFRVVRPALEKVIEGQIRNAFEKGDAYAHEIQTEANKAQQAAREDPENAPGIFSRYADAMRARAQAKAKKVEAVAKRDTKVQTVMTLHDSIFPDIKLPGGVSSKATEYVDLANKGERWESPIFSIGNAKESTDIPSPGNVTRKAPNPTTDGLRDASGPSEPIGQAIGHTNGHTNGSHTNGTNGFSREVDQAFVNDKTKNLSDGVTNGQHNVLHVPNTNTIPANATVV
jgi:hypothetical protein